MTLDQIDRMVRQANPVPELKEETSALPQPRRMEMQTKEWIEVEPDAQPARRGTFLAMAALLAVIVGALLVLRSVTEEALPVADQPSLTEVPAPSEDAAIETATAFVEAYAAYDAEAAASFLTTEALAEFGGAGGLRDELLFLQVAARQTLLLEPCTEAASTASGAIIGCPFSYHRLGSEALGRGPYGENRFEITVSAREITSISVDDAFHHNGFDDQMWEPFAQWVRDNHPDDVEIMYNNVIQTMWRTTDPSRVLWERHLEEWIGLGAPGGFAAERARSFLLDLGSFDVAQIESHLAPEADLSSFEWDGGDWRLAMRMLEAQGVKFNVDPCRVLSESASRTLVACSIDLHLLRSDEIGEGPFSGSTFVVTVADDRVTRASLNLDITEISPVMWEPFAAWVAENHPDDVAVMYTSSQQTREALNEDSIALWDQRIREYVAYVNG